MAFDNYQQQRDVLGGLLDPQLSMLDIEIAERAFREQFGAHYYKCVTRTADRISAKSHLEGYSCVHSYEFDAGWVTSRTTFTDPGHDQLAVHAHLSTILDSVLRRSVENPLLNRWTGDRVWVELVGGCTIANPLELIARFAPVVRIFQA